MTADDSRIVLSDLKYIISEGEKIGLSLNSTKCELYINEPDPENSSKILSEFKEVAPDICLIDDSELCLLGAPTLEKAYQPVVSSKLDELQKMTSRLAGLNRHEAFFLLKNCLFIPKLIFILRSTPFHSSDKLVNIDTTLYKSVSSLMNMI